MFRAALFDLDGTLLNTLEDIAASVNGALMRLGCPTHPADAYKQMVGDGMHVLAERAMPAEFLAKNPGAVESFIEYVKSGFRKNWPGNSAMYDGVEEMLDELKRRGFLFAVITNRPEDLARLMVDTLLAKWEFLRVCGTVNGNPPKPGATVAEDIAKSLGVPPSECLFLGDSNVDMQAAAAAGMYGVGALWGFRTREELLAHGAKALVENPGDVLRIIQ